MAEYFSVGKGNHMARYRMYKNGIYGHRYKGMYIVKGEREFSVLDGNGVVMEKAIPDYEDAEWCIDKRLASPMEIQVMRGLYGMEIYDLSLIMMRFIERKDKGEKLSESEESRYELVVKIRGRKADGKPF